MEKAWLESQLASGRSIEAIARDAGKHPSTVAYWVRKHGLASPHAARHAARGGIERSVLEPLVEQGLSTRDIAAALGVSQATVRHWLARHGLQTALAARRRAKPQGEDQTTVTAECHRHGTTLFRRRAKGGYRCLKCRSEAVSERRRAVKRTLVEEAGGRCVLCGYDRSLAALQFHHLDPAAKAFHLAHGGVARSIAAARAEAAKCALVCANCHAEIEAGVATMPQDAPDLSGVAHSGVAQLADALDC